MNPAFSSWKLRVSETPNRISFVVCTIAMKSNATAMQCILNGYKWITFHESWKLREKRVEAPVLAKVCCDYWPYWQWCEKLFPRMYYLQPQIMEWVRATCELTWSQWSTQYRSAPTTAPPLLAHAKCRVPDHAALSYTVDQHCFAYIHFCFYYVENGVYYQWANSVKQL